MTSYQIKKGDTLWDIARVHGITLEVLLAANPGIQNPHLIYPGEIINIPRVGSGDYLVTKGDTMWDIAQNYNISLNSLKAANTQISNPNLIYPGQIINIPDGISIDTPPEAPAASEREFEQEVVRLVNAERASNGVPSLNESNEISNVARVKSEDFIVNRYFAHNSPTYGTPFEMLTSFQIPYTAAAENIASGQRTPEEVMRYWMNSPGHRSNILNSYYNNIGVGVARDQNGNLYWTQLFTRN